ncbi:hypothetical protein [Riemerella anatipestifer]|uniref:hypothetical protein n=1 Tax=Riemerella anatipestifer TaxID=34085 RepID=UPI001F37DCA6|nr:hypothetical protein [Riemerella anatipestifer]
MKKIKYLDVSPTTFGIVVLVVFIGLYGKNKERCSIYNSKLYYIQSKRLGFV